MGTDLRLMPLPRNCVITNLHRHQLRSNTTTMAVSVLGMGAVAVEFNNTKSNTEDQHLPTENKCAITSERLTYLKRLVDDAIRDHRIFTIKGGWQTLRRCFLKRNWVEKYELAKSTKPGNVVNPSNCLDDLCSNLPTRQSWESPSAHIAKCERTIMSRLLQFHDVDFYWNTRKDQHDTHLRINCHKLINRFSRSLFTSKEGLCLLLQQMYWHNEPGIAQVNFPRCYVLGFPDHYNNFIEDFRITACTSLLKFIIHKYETEDKYVIQSPEGQIPYGSFKFAIARLNDYIDFRKHLDIDREATPVLDEQWDQFLKHFKLIIHENNVFLESKEYNLDELIAASKSVLKKIDPFWPQLDLDGMKNIWIMKPGNKCRGRGIQLIKDVKDVAKIMDLKLKYVVQKYIEKPLIIYETKFDIRQWFLITSVQPLMIWMYRESYLRFSSQNFSLENFHESLHLTNHAVQCKYKNKQDRNKALPDENMWDCHTFKTYLNSIGHENKWDAVIFPGMKESIIGSMLACQETMDRRPNTFELYGADFILAEDFKPWLLEINSSPDLSSSTSITAKMCPQCLEDIVKVVIDKRRDPNCETGLFEMIYKQNLPRAPAYLGMSLTVRGRKVFKRKTIRKDSESNKTKSNRSAKLSPPDMALTLPEPVMKEVVKKYTGPVIEDLMVELKRHAGQESDCEPGFEVAVPVKIERKKPANKSDSRVPRYQTIPPIEINESNSIRTKGNVRENYKTAQTLSSKMVRNNCSVSRRELSFDPKPHQDFWIDNVSILKGKNKLISRVNGDSLLAPSTLRSLTFSTASKSVFRLK
ncbi:PREDICTED: tubulin glycylase 3A-like [Nicrophorus vespilloides]|uniref:Tubulin glycylase 3A-like n=1 Tax=Nicrophorus vespilloides TaxID=110193 RepID=A0ABM1MSF8_NICVS|nr:PREDICTED: tubulin glycylase 3A-like [Nicrophorus vespilloides]XP_017777509.1 PREDICTED: tubulin glycylase 3A-like [Nicrophorus vespilloides]